MTFILSLIAAALAFSAAIINYVRAGELDIALIAGGLFVLAIGFTARSRISQ